MVEYDTITIHYGLKILFNHNWTALIVYSDRPAWAFPPINAHPIPQDIIREDNVPPILCRMDPADLAEVVCACKTRDLIKQSWLSSPTAISHRTVILP